MAEVDPIFAAKQATGIVQELKDRSAWPKVKALDVESEAAPVQVEDEAVDKPRRGRPPKAVDAE